MGSAEPRVFAFTSAATVRRHEVGAIVRAGLAGRGIEVKDEDGLWFLAFADADVALAWAGEVARALDAAGLALAIGMFAGEAVRREDPSGRPDWFGPPVNRAARLAQAAHAGQIVVGRGIAERASGLVVRELGPHHLRGVRDAEPLWQVAPPGLDQEFPRLSTEDRGAWPRSPQRLYGRDAELTELAEAASRRVRIATIIGGGGVGKTSLAVHAARRAQATWRVDAVDAEGLDADELTGAVLRALGATPGASVTDALAGRGPSLLLIDGARPEVGPLLRRWVEVDQQVRLLVTSQRPLGVPGEQLIRVEPLPVPADVSQLAEDPGAALLRDRLGPAADAWTPELVLEVVRQCGGLPLILETVAARFAPVPPDEVRAELARWAPTTDPGEHVARSLDSLPDGVREVFAQCAVFEGGFDVEAAEDVLDGGGVWVVDALDALVACALVRTVRSGGRARFELQPTVQSIAGARLGGRRADVQLRHARHYARRFRGAGGEVGDLVLDRANLKAAATFAVDTRLADEARRLCGTLLRVAEHVGPIHLGVDLAARALALPEVSPESTTYLQLYYGSVLRHLGRREEARTAFREAATSADARESANARILLASTYDGEEALGLGTEVLAFARSAGLTAVASNANLLLGNLLVRSGDLHAAERRLRDALGEAVAAADVGAEARALGALSSVLQAHGWFDEAFVAREAALAKLAATGSERDEAVGRGNLGNLQVEAGRPESALASYEAAAAAHRRLGNLRSLAFVLGNLGWCLHLLGRSARGRALLEEASALHEVNGSAFAARYTQHQLAELEVDLGEVAAAERRLGASTEPLAERVRGMLAARRGDPDEAATRFDTATAGFGPGPDTAWTWLREALGGGPRAEDRRARAWSWATEVGHPPTSPIFRWLGGAAPGGRG